MKTIESFIVGNSNKFAHAAAFAVAEKQSPLYSPLLIFGDPGTGKTHLLHAIGHYSSKKFPHHKIVYVKRDEFTKELIDAIKKGKCVGFREKYKVADLLLMDDVQSVAGKTETQNELLNIFCALHELGKQIVIASGRPPSEMATLEGGLIARFESSLMAEILPPDGDLRRAIISS